MPYLELPLNPAAPEIMHIDLNSCFASVEQQARPLLRGHPIGVTNRMSPNACVVAASYEAKGRGVRVGMGFAEAKLLAPELIMVETDPPKYRYVYQKLVEIMSSYSPAIAMKSIDEGVIDFGGTRQNINNRPLEEVGLEIKSRLKEEVGLWMHCNIGIAPNRFLAKLAASLNKPDGMDTIDRNNLVEVFSGLKLTDLNGIASRNQARLNSCGIYTPIQFLEAPAELLKKSVFKSVCGDDWYKRLRGYEVDNISEATRTVGRQYVLEHTNLSEEALLSRLFYLCETTGVKLRYKGLCARGIGVYARYVGGDYWQERKMFRSTFFSNSEIYLRTKSLFDKRPRHDRVREIGLSCYELTPSSMRQMSLLEAVNRQTRLTEAVDRVNKRWGDFTVTYTGSYYSKGVVKQKIPFGSTRYFELLCNQS